MTDWLTDCLQSREGERRGHVMICVYEQLRFILLRFTSENFSPVHSSQQHYTVLYDILLYTANMFYFDTSLYYITIPYNSLLYLTATNSTSFYSILHLICALHHCSTVLRVAWIGRDTKYICIQWSLMQRKWDEMNWRRGSEERTGTETQTDRESDGLLRGNVQ